MSAGFPAPSFHGQPVFGDTPVGAVVAFAGASAGPGAGPGLESQGWMVCDGRMLAVEDYPQLYMVLGYLYGGADGQFRLPDYRGGFLGQGAPQQDGGPHGTAVSYLIKFGVGLRP